MGTESCQERTLPLKIVLGILSNEEQELYKPTPSPAPASLILGTSYYDYTKYKKLNKDGRVPMEDRKGFFEHFRPKTLVLSVSKVIVIFEIISDFLTLNFASWILQLKKINRP